MIKKVLAFILCAITALTLCGCDGYRETDNCYIVSAVGFDGGEKIKISVEVISTGGGERSSAPTSEIISGEGESPEGAMFSLTSKVSKILMFDHCTAIIVGESIKNEQLDKVFDFGQELKEINLSVYMVRTGSAERLFNDSSPISVARGFDIAGNIKETEKDTGIDYNDRFFQLFAAYKNGEYYGMPILKAENGKIIIDGEEICKGRQTRERLSNEESLIYSFLINKNSGGKIYFGKEYADVSQCRVDYKNKKYYLTVRIKNESNGFKKVFSEKCKEFLKNHKDKTGFKTDKIEVSIKGGV